MKITDEHVRELMATVGQLQERIDKLEEIARVSAKTDAMIVHILNNHSASHEMTIVNLKKLATAVGEVAGFLGRRG